jgi:hypothetical protein
VRERRSCPKPPELFEKVLNGDKSIDIEALNQQSSYKYNDEALVPCACGRTFLPDSLLKH